LRFLVPLTLDHLKARPLAEAEFHPGDLLKTVTEVDESFWKTHRDLRRRLLRVLRLALGGVEEAATMPDLEPALRAVLRAALQRHETALARRPSELQATLDRLYALYADRPTGRRWCDFCWNDAEIGQITVTPVQDISDDMAGKLLHETADHFESSDVYKHYLPRILDALAPPRPAEDCYPLHLFETLEYMRYHSWPRKEQQLVLRFLEELTPLLSFEFEPGRQDEESREEWHAGLAFLRDRTPLPKENDI
jgi:hypothetical protein